MKNPVSPLTRAHLEMAAALRHVIEKRLGIIISTAFSCISPEEYLFGSTEKSTAVPHIGLSILGGGMGDYYSGSYDYQDVYRAENITDEKGNRTWICYDHQSTNLAGDCSLFSASYTFPQAALDTIENEFYDTLKAGLPVPAEWLSLLPGE